MTDTEKLILIKAILANASPLDYEPIISQGVSHGMVIAMECIIEFKGGEADGN